MFCVVRRRSGKGLLAPLPDFCRVSEVRTAGVSRFRTLIFFVRREIPVVVKGAGVNGVLFHTVSRMTFFFPFARNEISQPLKKYR